jgi:hypothetical protein
MRATIRCVIFASSLALLSGCGSPHFQYAEVSGRVTLDGKPLSDVEVVFVPDPTKGTKGGRAGGYTDPDGRYRLSTPLYKGNGAAVGFHNVIFRDIWALPGPGGRSGPPAGTVEEAPGRSATNGPKQPRFPSTYTQINTTPFKGVEVKQEANEFNFDLLSRTR